MRSTSQDSGPGRRPHSLTPLGIIATFIGLAETVTGIAAAKTAGGIQVAFTVFAIGFPVFVAVAFFTVLWTRPYVLYPPKEFGPKVNVREYVEAMRRQVLTEQEVLVLVRTAVGDAIRSQDASSVIASTLATPQAPPNSTALERAATALAEQAVQRLEQATITVDLSPISGGQLRSVIQPYNHDQLAFNFLTDIYYQISDYAGPFTYAKAWVLEDVSSGLPLVPSGVDWDDVMALVGSHVTVAEFGFAPGMRLRAVRVTNATHSDLWRSTRRR